MLIHDEQSGTGRCGRSVRRGPIRHLVAHPGEQDDDSAIPELRVKRPFEAEQDVPLLAPVIRYVPCGVFDHADPNITKLVGPPVCYPGPPGVLN